MNASHFRFISMRYGAIRNERALGFFFGSNAMGEWEMGLEPNKRTNDKRYILCVYFVAIMVLSFTMFTYSLCIVDDDDDADTTPLPSMLSFDCVFLCICNWKCPLNLTHFIRCHRHDGNERNTYGILIDSHRHRRNDCQFDEFKCSDRIHRHSIRNSVYRLSFDWLKFC